MKKATITRTSERSYSYNVDHGDQSLSLGNDCRKTADEMLDAVTGMIRELKADGYKVRTYGFGRIQ